MIKKVSDYFNNPNDSRWTRFKRWVSESMEKLPDLVQGAIEIDLNDRIKSLKEKFGGNKEKSKIPESNSKTVGNFVPSSTLLIGVLGVLTLTSGLAFVSAATLVLVGSAIVIGTKTNNLISSDKEKEGTIHNPIKSGSKDHTQSRTKAITCNDKIITNHVGRVENERNQKEATCIRGRR
ncbi:MAG: hypothetical protein sL5_01040 [Candidatus Mesenet longicola]|uniref:Uncharacterized protein n=1 Tax=Candidatus Mesenet longicola TaxID=1892558 RepID=A0A8J3HVL0_9RICK|nr:MAG: hypothetical protein sGL2_01320 [Candidatus Mesenet longicola]GHM59111.1 MAG: hypothetical protein sL5_01040 [Candidatus Mesenet longicola]